jgi:hypothetical protein
MNATTESKTWRQIDRLIERARRMGENSHRLPMPALTFLLLALLVPAASAYPPAPDHTFYGMVRNEWGDPINISGARVFITSTNGASARAPVAASIEPGINYRLIVPMDSARSLKTDLTSGGSLRQSQPFQLKVQIGAITYLPIEMVLSRPIGDPAGTSRLNLTLGIDSDGDGLPDAWEIAMGLNPNDPNDAKGDADDDGLSNEDEYRAGTYAFDPNDGFRLSLVGVEAGQSQLEFMAVSGRTYTVYSSPDLQQWSPVSFRVVTGGVAGALQGNYPSTDVRTLRIQVPSSAGTTNRYFKAMVQ